MFTLFLFCFHYANPACTPNSTLFVSSMKCIELYVTNLNRYDHRQRLENINIAKKKIKCEALYVSKCSK